MAGPPVLYYLAIDGTESQDAAVFGALLEGRGWRNLASAYLKPAPDDPTRLLDPHHEYLPIPLVEANGRKIAVVAPGGRDAKGLDRFWRQVGMVDLGGSLVDGRRLAADLSANFMGQLILRPAIHTHELEPDVLKRHFADENLPYGSPHAPVARILYVSSHGYQNGVMVADAMRYVAHPEKREASYRSLFAVSQAAQHGQGFHGPEWIVLAQCSTVNPSVWALWGRILAASSPGVRGILAYEEGSPKPQPAIRVAERFFGHLDQGVAFLDAWAEANQGMRWSALVHKEARQDTLTGLSRWQRLSDLTTSATTANYHGYSQSAGPAGQPVYDTLPPFWLKLEHQSGRGGIFEELVADRFGDPQERLREGDGYRWTVHGEDLGALREVTITVVYLRDTFRENQPPWNKLFGEYLPMKGVAVEGFNTTTVVLRPDPSLNPSSLTWECRGSSGRQAGLEEYHSFLWFRVAIRTDAGTLRHDFRTVGLYF
jgi:hypothetical protein